MLFYNFAPQFLDMTNGQYTEALEMYENTGLTQVEICKRLNLSVVAFRAYLQRFRRDLIFKKRGILICESELATQRIRSRKGQTQASQLKYKTAKAKCRSLTYIYLTLSQIAHDESLNPTALANQLRAHYPDLIIWRTKEREMRGFLKNNLSGPMKKVVDQYKDAVELYAESQLTIQEVAIISNVSFSGLKQHLLFYHKDLVAKRERLRARHSNQKNKGEKNGNNTLHSPKPSTVGKYAHALEYYEKSGLTLKEIASKTMVTYAGLYGYIRVWHRDLTLKRGGIDRLENVDQTNLNRYKHYLASSREKYQPAIELLKKNGLTIAAVAKLFNLHPESFRMYLKEHEPDLTKMKGMMCTPEGRLVSRSSYEKYKKGVELYSSSSLSQKEVALKINVHPISFGNYLRRNYPELVHTRREIEKMDK